MNLEYLFLGSRKSEYRFYGKNPTQKTHVDSVSCVGFSRFINDLV